MQPSYKSRIQDYSGNSNRRLHICSCHCFGRAYVYQCKCKAYRRINQILPDNKKTSDVAGLTATQVADNELAFNNGFNPPVDWTTDPRVFTGEQTLNSRKNLGVTTIMPSTEYTVYAFGVSAEGVRTTIVSTLNVTTPSATESAMTLSIKDVTAGGETDPNDWFGNTIPYFTYGITPSVDNEYYYTGVVNKSDYDTFPDDKAFMADAIAKAGDLIMMNCYMGKTTVSSPHLHYSRPPQIISAILLSTEIHTIYSHSDMRALPPLPIQI